MCWYLFCLCCTLYLNFKTSLRYPIVLFAKLIRRWRIVCTLAGRAGVSVSPSERLMRRQKGFEWRWLCPKWRHSRISFVYNRRKERLERAAREREKKRFQSTTRKNPYVGNPTYYKATTFHVNKKRRRLKFVHGFWRVSKMEITFLSFAFFFSISTVHKAENM